MRILVVDDDRINNKMICKKLEKRGFEVVEAFNGHECLEAVENKQIDLVLLDIMMPDMFGSDVLVELRKNYSAFELPIIMVTGKSETEDIVECLRAGANDYIVKPINIEVALARISAQLTLKKMHHENLSKAELETAQAMIVTYNHEINNPLTIALGLLGRVKGEENLENVAKISDALFRIVDIVKKIQQISNETQLKHSSYTDQEKMIKLK
ncbi:PleD family two-component system response regulator [Bacteriovorax sp. Seq25_V]|uniref:response regulator n=1 Tax=Bacteriovorax sp. Seq25_V TaxID=1201288 RepID=UPI00038A3EBE|nr:response regulator [Bacteriovorax sp. Seq25_V]EQC45496.1 response regulator receiver domain protein [Bacteriovorax sp. Seq25_V]